MRISFYSGMLIVAMMGASEWPSVQAISVQKADEDFMWAPQTEASTDTDAQFVGGLVESGINFAKGLFGRKQAPCPTPDKKAMKHIIEKKT